MWNRNHVGNCVEASFFSRIVDEKMQDLFFFYLVFFFTLIISNLSVLGQVKLKTYFTSGFWKNRRKRAFLFSIFYSKENVFWHHILSIQ